MATEDARKLFVAGLPDSITEDALREIFEATGGKVTDVSLPRDRATGRVRGFGFVTFASPEEAAAYLGKTPQEFGALVKQFGIGRYHLPREKNQFVYSMKDLGNAKHWLN